MKKETEEFWYFIPSDYHRVSLFSTNDNRYNFDDVDIRVAELIGMPLDTY